MRGGVNEQGIAGFPVGILWGSKQDLGGFMGRFEGFFPGRIVRAFFFQQDFEGFLGRFLGASLN